MKQNYFYKVTSKSLKSAWITSVKKLCIQYVIGKLIYPKLKGSKSMVFKSLKSAKKWKDALSHRIFNPVCYLKLFKCTVKNPKLKRKFANSSLFENNLMKKEIVDNIIDFWKARSSNNKFMGRQQPAPSGTYFCDAVKLIEEV